MPAARAELERLFEQIVQEEGQRLLGWRDVPTDDWLLGPSAVAVEPVFRQIFIGRAPDLAGPDARLRFERKLYVIRKRIEHAVDALGLTDEARKTFYIVSLSCNTLIYKGMLTADPDRDDVPRPDRPRRRVGAGARAPAVQHQHVPVLAAGASVPLRRAQRRDQHAARQHQLDARARGRCCKSDVLGDDLRKILPIIREGGSDTATFDNVLEFLVMTGRSLPHAMLMMIPEPWSKHEAMAPERKAFYEYHSSLMEPWDGPASIAFTDGTVIGAVLDRNGLRPSRYYVTKDDLVIMASEVGVLDIPPENILLKERLHPGRIFLVDTARGRIVADEEIKQELAAAQPYAAVAGAEPRRHRGPAAGAVPAAAHATRPCCSGSRCSATRTRTSGSCSTPMAPTARSRSARWAPTRRWRCCRIGRACSTTTSSSSSRRSPTRRSTRSARSW